MNILLLASMNVLQLAAATANMDILEIAYGGSLQKVRSEQADVKDLTLDAVQVSVDLPAPANMDSAVHSYRHFVYGEVLPSSFAAMLQYIGAKESDRYYDLGAGDGKTAGVAWSLGLHAVGIELIERRFNASCGAVSALREALREPAHAAVGHSGSLRMVHGSFLHVDWSDADIVFVASVTFNDALMGELAARARHLRRGAKIVSWHAFPGPEFRSLGDGVVHMQTSWQAWDDEPPLPFSLQEKVTEPAPARERPHALAGTGEEFTASDMADCALYTTSP